MAIEQQLSRLKGKNVTTENGRNLGQVEDLHADEHQLLSLVVQTNNKNTKQYLSQYKVSRNRFEIPVSSIKSAQDQVILQI